MDYLENKVKLIKQLQYGLSSKDEDVFLVYKGTTFGNATPWNIRCGNFEANAESTTTCIDKILLKIKNELQKKLQDAESQTLAIKKILGNLQN